ncbi:MAG: hypothetical protein AAGA66_10100 [Bacteroidota bacterium]
MKKNFVAVILCAFGASNLFSQEIKITEKPKKLDETINSSVEEVQPLLGNDNTLYFVRTFYEKNIGGTKGGQDIWVSTKSDTSWLEPTNLTELNNAYNNAVVGVSENNNTLYLLNSYSNPLRWKFGISVVNKTGQGWSKPKEFPISFDSKGDLRGYYVSPGEDVILVSSESDSTFGKEDIYIYYKEDNVWKGPIHLDDKINTESSEISPFITSDYRVIFFASEGHDGYGNYDIYASERIGDSWDNWSPAKNLGSEVNTGAFEGYFSTYENGVSYYASKASGGSTDLYSTRIGIELRGIKNDFLAYSDQLRMDFKRTLLKDTLLHGKVDDIAQASAETPHNISNVLKGNDLFNRRLIGMEERDSLINLYASEQLNDGLSEVEYDKRKLWNRALSEDIRSAVDRNLNIEEKLSAIRLNDPPNSSSEQEKLMHELKSDISKQMIENATIKQEITELIAQNAFSKHNYTQFYEDIKVRTFSEEKILANNEVIEEKIANWYANIESINLKTDELIQVTSQFEVYLSANTKRNLSDVAPLNQLDGLLNQDTAINNQILTLGEKNPELINIVDQLISNNSVMTDGLIDIQVDDSLINDYVQKMSGLKRDSEEYSEVSQTISALVDDINDIINTNSRLAPESVLLAKENQDSLTLDLTDKIAKEIEIKQNISELILKNDLLKQSLLDDTDGGDSTTLQISNNEIIIEQQLKKLQEAIEAVESSGLEVEKIASPQLYASHILEKNSDAISNFNSLLESGNQISEGISQLTTLNRKIDPILIGMSQDNVALNDEIVKTGKTYTSSNGAIIGLVKSSDSLSNDLKKFLENNTGLAESTNNSVQTNKQQTSDLISQTLTFTPKSPRAYSDYELDMSELLAKNGTLKQEVLSLISENAAIRQKMLESNLMDTLITTRMEKNTLIIEEKVAELEANLQLMQDRTADFEEELTLERRINTILTRYDDLYQLLAETISADTVASRLVIRSVANEDEKEKAYELVPPNSQLNAKLGSINDLCLTLNQNILERTNSNGLDSDNANENVNISSQIVQLDSAMDVVMEKIKPLTSTQKDNFSVFLNKTSKLKQDIATLIGHNASFKMYLDTTDFLGTDVFFVEMIESNSELIYDKITEWRNMLKPYTNDSKMDEVAFVKTSEVEKGTKIEGYAVQVLAMANGIEPLKSYLAKLDNNELKKSVGLDGLDRYHIGTYETKRQALKAMRSLRSQGYRDAFVRAIVRYGELSSGYTSGEQGEYYESDPLEGISVQTIENMALVVESSLSKDTKIDGYAVQLLAMPSGKQPSGSYLKDMGIDSIKRSQGKDGLDRYYIGKYEDKKEALWVVKSLKSKGYDDVFIRALVSYDML